MAIVKAVNLIPEFAPNDMPPDFQRWGQAFVFNREAILGQDKTADAFDGGQARIGGVDIVLNEADDFIAAAIGAGDAGFRWHHHGREPWASIAINHGLGDVGLTGQAFFYTHGRDVLATRIDDDILAAADDGDIAIGVHFRQITRMKPTFLKNFGGVFRAIPIALHDQITAHQQFTFIAEFDAHPGQSGAYAGDADVIRGAGANHR